MTVEELLARISSRELSEWMALAMLRAAEETAWQNGHGALPQPQSLSGW